MGPARTNAPGRNLRPFVEKLRAGDPIGHANLTLVPLRGDDQGQLDYLLAADAIQAGVLTVSEVSQAGSVPELLAVNESDKTVLLLDGEELVGAKQNRILNTTVLLPARSKTRIPVSCVEQGRWHHVSREFAAGSYSPSRLRAVKSRDVSRNLRITGRAESDQGTVWEEVAACMQSVAAASPTMAMHDVIRQRRQTIDGYTKALPYPPRARGVAAAINGHLAAIDLFDKAGTMEKVWQRLLSGYALDALCSLQDKADARRVSARAAETLLEHLGKLDCQPCRSVGLGEDWRFEAEDVIGQALVVEGQCIHLSAFPSIGVGGRARPEQPILPPSRRRRRPPNAAG